MGDITERFKISMKDRPSGFINELARRLKDDVKDNTPYVTGRLEGGWRARGSKNGILSVWNNVDYASYVEENVEPNQEIILTLWRSEEIITIKLSTTSRPRYEE